MIILLSGCKPQSNKNDVHCATILKVDATAKETSLKSLFSSCEIIPLESGPKSVLSEIDKAFCFDEGIILLDMRMSTVFHFDSNGVFRNRIGERGQGPEDYLLCYDFCLNKSTKEVSLLSPYGEIINYNLNGQFLNRKSLPHKSNYFACSWINHNDLALWSAVNSDEGGLSVVNIESGKQYYEDWFNDRIIDMCSLKPFYQWNESIYFAAPLTNIVYEVTDTCMYCSYIWDFGEKNASAKYLSMLTEIQNPSDRNKKIISDMESGSLAYSIFNGENDQYYFIALANGIGDNRVITNIFYNKSDSEGVAVERFKEGITLHPIFLNDEFILSIVPHNEIAIYNSILNTDYECSEDDNPLLAKFYFNK
ncbi:MAG: 6-bladed beta-propeller [Muribaculaceae bacterium]|nr:6-bladed beta-propeller [Muribaculaceae bacterium]